MDGAPEILITGASGYIGFDVVARILEQAPTARLFALVRDPSRFTAMCAAFGTPAQRITPVPGDLCQPQLGLSDDARAFLARRITHIIHSGADVVFTRALAASRETNTSGTSRVLAFADDCVKLERFLYVSTAFVAGRRAGSVREDDNGSVAGWVNAYEQSKYEAEALVRSSQLPWSIARPATIACDTPGGAVRQIGALHHAARLWRDGLVPMMPVARESTVDIVSLEMVAQGIVDLLRHPHGIGATVHLCAGASAMRVHELLDLAWNEWSADASWRTRNIARPVFVDLDTYAAFERDALARADPHTQRIVRSLSVFAPTLAYPKCFETSRAKAMLRIVPPSAEAMWRTVFAHVAATPRTPTAT